MRELDRKIENMSFILNEAVLPILSEASHSDVINNRALIIFLAEIKRKGNK